MAVYVKRSEDYLQHHGVKGMKWGVRRTPEQLGHKKAYKDIKKSYKQGNDIPKEYKKRLRPAVDSVKKIYSDNLNDKLDWSKGSAEYQAEEKAQKAAEELLGKYKYKKLKDMDGRNDLAIAYIRRYVHDKGLYESIEEHDKKYFSDLPNKTLFDDQITNYRPKFGVYGIEPLTVKTKIGSNKNVEVNVDCNEHDTPSSAKLRAQLSQKFLNKYDDNKVRNRVAIQYYDENEPWINDGPTKITRKQFMDKLELESIRVDTDYDMYEAIYRDGGTYGGHWLVVEGDMKNGNPRRISLEG